MPLFERESKRIVIAGASSLLGAELKALLEESKLADWDFRLVDEEDVAGTLTEAGGEPAVIQPVEEGTFNRARLIFFTGSPEFTRTNIGSAMQRGARIIDLSGAVFDETETEVWFPGSEALRNRAFHSEAEFFATPSAAGLATIGLSFGLRGLGLHHLAAIFFQPVSEFGRRGIEELESQTGQLLSFESVGKTVFDAQVAFNLLDRFGPESGRKLAAVRERVRMEARVLLEGADFVPAVQVVHAPVFYGTAFAASARFDPLGPELKLEKIVKACEAAGFVIAAGSKDPPSNVSVAGENRIHLSAPELDSGRCDTWWFWGAADNIRLPAANAVKLAEKLT
ncbi:MAG TPA: Asd/ArgC dimerization domain-containing protein [Candidatus Angelobacter sp.]|nr:Asd/ArgC dimerization domain-containing protein [Candidatus Angelobacter sp.]